MDYDITVSNLENNIDHLNNINKNLRGLYNEFQSSYINSLSNSVLGSNVNAIKRAIEKIEKGTNNSYKWLNDYKTDLIKLENDLANFKISSVDSPVDFIGNFTNIFGKMVIPTLKTGVSNEEKQIVLSNGIVSLTHDLTSGYNASSKLYSDGKSVYVNCDLQKVINNFGSQNDDNGAYPYDLIGCDNYARGYCINIQTGSVVGYSDVCYGGAGLQCNSIDAGSRKAQAKIAYNRLINEGKPSVIHVNSPYYGSGLGHYVTVIGYREGVTAEDVKIDDLLIIDPADGKVKYCSEDSEYCREDLSRCRWDPGYHVNSYDY